MQHGRTNNLSLLENIYTAYFHCLYVHLLCITLNISQSYLQSQVCDFSLAVRLTVFLFARSTVCDISSVK